MRIKGTQSSKNNQSIQSVGASHAQAPMGAENEQNLREQFKAAMETFAGTHSRTDSNELSLDTFQVESPEKISADSTRIAEFVNVARKVEKESERIDSEVAEEREPFKEKVDGQDVSLNHQAETKNDAKEQKATAEQQEKEVAPVQNDGQQQNKKEDNSENLETFVEAQSANQTAQSNSSEEVSENSLLASELEKFVEGDDSSEPTPVLAKDIQENAETTTESLKAQLPKAENEGLAENKSSQNGQNIPATEQVVIEATVDTTKALSLKESLTSNLDKIKASEQATFNTTVDAQKVLDTVDFTSNITSSLTQSLLKATATKDLIEKAIQGTEIKKALNLTSEAQQQSNSTNQLQPFGFSQIGSIQTKTASENKATRNIPKALADKALERVENTLKEIARSKDGKSISLRLDPPELGSVKIDLTLRDGSLHARLVAESAQVSTLLREKAHDLQGMLRKLGLDVDNISVSVRSDEKQEQSLSFQQNTTKREDGAPQREVSKGSQGDTTSNAVNVRQKKQTNQTLDHWVA